MTTATPRPGPVPGPPAPKPAPPPGRQGQSPGAGQPRVDTGAPRYDRVPMTGAQSLVRSLEEVGCEVVFGIPGGTILPAYDPLLDSTKVRHVLVRHEQGAGHAATGYAQATGKVGVCMATSGPGATNLVTPIADAHMDSIPVVAITGQQTRPLIGTDAFQEADITGITMPITKHNMLVTDATEIPRAIVEAFHLASTGRPGPVLVDIPKDVLQEKTTFTWPPEMKLPGYRPTTRPHGKQIREAARLMSRAKQPVLYVGGGVLKARASGELKVLAELSGAPVVTTLMARGISAASLMSMLCLVTGIVMPVMSASWKASVPISALVCWPVMATTGTESMCASARGVTKFVAPGPDVAIHTPTRPVACA